MNALSSNVEILRNWLRTNLSCVPGKREFSAGRYFITAIHDAQSMELAFHDFLASLRRREVVAGLFVVSETVALPRDCTAADQFLQCAELMRNISDLSPQQLANGGRLGKVVDLECPVTGVMQSFDDFDAVAFCPQSFDLHDPLYDPMMGAPVACVNFSSDIYAFSVFTRDLSLKIKNSEVRDLDIVARREIFAQASKIWQQYAVATIRGYMSITDLSLALCL